MYEDFKAHGIDEIYCLSVNDSYVMNKWAQGQGLKNVKVITDGSGEFTRKMGMLVEKHPEGFGMRSWRYAVIINDGNIEEWFIEQDSVIIVLQIHMGDKARKHSQGSQRRDFRRKSI